MFGDSITYGLSATAGQSYSNLFTPINAGVSAAQAAEVSNHVQQESVNPFKAYTILVGANDATRYKDNPLLQQHFKSSLRASIAWLSLLDKKTANKDLTLSGTWAKIPAPNPVGMYTTQSGASASTQIKGSTIYVGLSAGDFSDMSNFVVVEIDGIEYPHFSLYIPGSTTWLGQWWSRVCFVFDGLENTTHTVKITNKGSEGKFLHLDYIASNNQSTCPVILIGTIPKCTDTFCTSTGITQQTVQAYRNIIVEIANEFSARLVHTDLAMTEAGISSDGLHPNNIGHLQIHNAFWQKLIGK